MATTGHEGSPTKTIRAHCLEYCNGSRDEVDSVRPVHGYRAASGTARTPEPSWGRSLATPQVRRLEPKERPAWFVVPDIRLAELKPSAMQTLDSQKVACKPLQASTVATLGPNP